MLSFSLGQIKSIPSTSVSNDTASGPLAATSGSLLRSPRCKEKSNITPTETGQKQQAVGHYISASSASAFGTARKNQLTSLQQKQGMSNSWHGFVRNKPHWAHLASFCGQAIGSVGRAAVTGTFTLSHIMLSQVSSRNPSSGHTKSN